MRLGRRQARGRSQGLCERNTTLGTGPHVMGMPEMHPKTSMPYPETCKYVTLHGRGNLTWGHCLDHPGGSPELQGS